MRIPGHLSFLRNPPLDLQEANPIHSAKIANMITFLNFIIVNN